MRSAVHFAGCSAGHSVERVVRHSVERGSGAVRTDVL